MIYPDAKITHLTQCHSNHCPMLLETQSRTQNGRIRPFRFQIGWLLDSSLFSIVHQAWEGNNRLVDAINFFLRKLRSGIKINFGIFSLEKRI